MTVFHCSFSLSFHLSQHPLCFVSLLLPWIAVMLRKMSASSFHVQISGLPLEVTLGSHLSAPSTLQIGRWLFLLAGLLKLGTWVFSERKLWIGMMCRDSRDPQPDDLRKKRPNSSECQFSSCHLTKWGCGEHDRRDPFTMLCTASDAH